MKISMILTSLVVAMGLSACDNAGKPTKKTSDAMEKSPDVSQKTEELKDPAVDNVQPVPPPE